MSNKMVTVCDKCFRAACWLGEFMCDEAYSAGTCDKSTAELALLGREHPEYWDRKEVQAGPTPTPTKGE